MLVLSRRRDEVVMIGDGDSLVTVKVVDIRGDKVRLGITAPRSIPVHRKEVYDAIARERAGDTNLPIRQYSGQIAGRPQNIEPHGPISWPWQLMADTRVKCLGCGVILPNDNCKYELKLHAGGCHVGSTSEPASVKTAASLGLTTGQPLDPESTDG